ncbi:MAG: hypothetical protein WDN76_00395 [Alphaproteobacteria bacterium]
MAKDEGGGGGGNLLATIAKIMALVAGIPAAAAAGYQLYAVATGKTPLQDYINPPAKAPIVYVAPGGRAAGDRGEGMRLRNRKGGVEQGADEQDARRL